MTTDILEINNFVILIEQSNDTKTTFERCDLDDQVIGFSFYGSGNVELSISFGEKTKKVINSSGIATSFYGNKNVEFIHKISHKKPLQSVSVFSTLNNINKLPKQEKDIYSNHLSSLLKPSDDYVEGPFFNMTPEMQNAVTKIFKTKYTGTLRRMFLQSQITELLAHFFSHISEYKKETIKISEKEKLYNAKDIISNNIATPPSLNELSKMIGLNNNKLKKNFKELFGVPVFKYLQNERLEKAQELLRNSEMNIQEVSWFVGYESVSSFSNAFLKKFGFRPSEVNK